MSVLLRFTFDRLLDSYFSFFFSLNLLFNTKLRMIFCSLLGIWVIIGCLTGTSAWNLKHCKKCELFYLFKFTLNSLIWWIMNLRMFSPEVLSKYWRKKLWRHFLKTWTVIFGFVTITNSVGIVPLCWWFQNSNCVEIFSFLGPKDFFPLLRVNIFCLFFVKV